MNKYHIRFNKSRGQPGRGTPDHVWRVFENGQEYLVKHVKFTCQCMMKLLEMGQAGTIGISLAKVT